MTQPTHVVCPVCQAVNRIPADKLNSHPKCGKCKKTLFTGQPVELSDHSFARHISRSDLPVVVDFWAAWCGPCKMMAPQFERAASQMEPHVRFAKLNTEQAQQTAARFGIRSIPTIAMFKNGKEIARQAGAMDAGMITQWIRSNL